MIPIYTSDSSLLGTSPSCRPISIWSSAKCCNHQRSVGFICWRCACWHDRFWIASCSLQSFAPNQGASASILTYWDPWPARRLVTVVIAQISRVLHGKAVLPLIYFACRNHTQHRLHTNGSTQSLPPSVTRLSWWWYGLEKRLATTRDNHGSEERLHIQWQVIRVTE